MPTVNTSRHGPAKMTLPASISNRSLSIAAFAVVSLWIILAFATWQYRVSGVYFWPPNVDVYGLELLFKSSVQVIPILGILALNAAAAVLGYGLVVRPIWGAQNLAAPVWLLFAGVVPGCLLIAALSRIVTLFLPNSIAPALILLAICGATTMTAVWIARTPGSKTEYRVTWRSLSVAMIAVIIALIFEVQFDRFHVAGEAILFFIEKVFTSPQHGIGTAGYWPLLSFHYDEGAFLYPVVYGLAAPGASAEPTLTVLYWISLALGRLGAVSITYVAVRSFGVDRLSSLIVVAFVLGASLSLNPLASNILFDSMSPLAYALHVSRFIVPVLPFLLVSAACAPTKEPTRLTLAVAGFLGVGLASMTIHVALVLLWGVALLVLTLLNPSASRSPLSWRAACAASIVLLAGLSITYGLGLSSVHVKVAALLAAAAISVLLVGLTLLEVRGSTQTQSDPKLRAAAMVFAVLCGGYLVGILLFGNGLAYYTQSFMGWLWPWSEHAIVDRYTGMLASRPMEMMQSPYCGGSEWAGRMLGFHCGSLPFFARTYGLPLVVMTAVLAWWLRHLPQTPSSGDRRLTMIYWGIVLSFVAFPISFILLDFVVASAAPPDWPPGNMFWLVWVRSRFIEPWFYSGLLLALALYLNQCGTRERRWVQSAMLIAIAVFLLNPLLLPAQFMANAAYLLAAIAGI